MCLEQHSKHVLKGSQTQVFSLLKGSYTTCQVLKMTNQKPKLSSKPNLSIDSERRI